ASLLGSSELVGVFPAGSTIDLNLQVSPGDAAAGELSVQIEGTDSDGKTHGAKGKLYSWTDETGRSLSNAGLLDARLRRLHERRRRGELDPLEYSHLVENLVVATGETSHDYRSPAAPTVEELLVDKQYGIERVQPFDSRQPQLAAATTVNGQVRWKDRNGT